MFAELERWNHRKEAQWIYSGATWQIVIGESEKVLPEDIPSEIAKLLPGIRWLTCMNLEGKRTKASTHLLRSTAKSIAKAMHGVILDNQEDTTTTPSGVKRFVTPEKCETFSILRLSWWFLGGPLLDQTGRESFLAILESLLPEAMPRRYGDYEPPQYLYAETGKEHLLTFLEPNPRRLSLVWYPHRPVTSVHWALPDKPGASPMGFRSNLVEVEIEAAALTQPGWAENMSFFWGEVSKMVRPFYGEVRTFGGYVRRGGTIFSTGESQRGTDSSARTPKSWWWRGVPPRLGQAVVLGEIYQSLWPEFAANSKLDGGLAFASTPNWSNSTGLSMSVPDSLVMPPESERHRENRYAEDWPFGPPFAPGNSALRRVGNDFQRGDFGSA